MGARLQVCAFGQTVDGAARRNFPVLFEVVKRRVLLCQAFLLNDTEVIERLIGNLRVGNHVLCWAGDKRCPVLWPLKSCSSSCS